MLPKRTPGQNRLHVTEDAVIWRGVRYETRYFLRRVYYYLHARPRLLEKPCYRCLYEESLNLQAERMWREAESSKKGIDLYRHMLRKLATMSVRSNGKNGSSLSRDAMCEYLRYRRGVWGCAERSCKQCEKPISGKNELSQ